MSKHLLVTKYRACWRYDSRAARYVNDVERPTVNNQKYKTLGDFMAARARGEIPDGSRVVDWTSTGAITIQSAYDNDGECVLYYRAETLETFMLEFAAALGLEGQIT